MVNKEIVEGLEVGANVLEGRNAPCPPPSNFEFFLTIYIYIYIYIINILKIY